MHQSSKSCEGDDLRYKPSQAPADLNSKVFGADYDGDIALVIVNRALAPRLFAKAGQQPIDMSMTLMFPKKNSADVASSSGQ